ncbi:hypothetical protein BS636_10410 [Acinetobacter sp. LoGeW2-3]|uniref:hypothetical protein n=1 Tax=Acinetobacter sp. LoGeW2-3 TaxID=1808001 RepID=UPI000C05C3F8|nr:hypothetical protein [Acinetobacter sp. LoGeW2-3]ATO20038.1 hypothetical protein BS636_10410 [Acinetobacter sp. LoGeW2-3]
MQHYLEFDAFDNPMQLSKVGNWVITFISAADDDHIQLAITYVLPRQISDALQPRRVLIEKTFHEHQWLIQTIECFDSQSNQEVQIAPSDELGQQTLQQILEEFGRYDVNVTLKSF